MQSLVFRAPDGVTLGLFWRAKSFHWGAAWKMTVCSLEREGNDAVARGAKSLFAGSRVQRYMRVAARPKPSVAWRLAGAGGGDVQLHFGGRGASATSPHAHPRLTSQSAHVDACGEGRHCTLTGLDLGRPGIAATQWWRSARRHLQT
ncbi:hypothetical protein VFPFJ_07791 [Purpureocillium lilacinum]|uniref:Uncharacterized protein n=1 Tax=Purpureocillium lilacinum TaxID=33203 RepID=A0A179H5Y0_PURLI|nr:hypothetical protein VFPFJ_07791 [Purpureocillium lilacinum]OAQ85402.1 hypothetical protein VFPFJ_07791 [Purpureocillium lilacinum]